MMAIDEPSDRTPAITDAELAAIDNRRAKVVRRLTGGAKDLPHDLALAYDADFCRLRDEVERMRGGPCGREDRHQREHLKFYGLADEFPFGCDSIDAVAEALLEARREIRLLKVERDRLGTVPMDQRQYVLSDMHDIAEQEVERLRKLVPEELR